MKKAIYFLFYKIYCFWNAISNDNLSDWKALVILSGIQALLLIELYVWCDVIFKEKNIEFSNPILVLVLLATVIIFANYYFFISNDKWKVHAEEFKLYTKKQNVYGVTLIIIFIVCVVISIIFSFYQISKIDWSQYR